MDSRGRLFVGDRENNRIQIFDQEGKFIAEWRQFGRPSGISIMRDDTIYVTDSESGPDTGARELPGIKKGIRIGSAKDGSVRAFIEDMESTVADHSGAEGLGVEPGLHYIPADQPRQFADAVLGLLRDPARRAQLGAAGRHLVETFYSWPTIGRAFEQRCEEVVAEHAYSRRSADRRAHLSRGGTPRSRRARVVAGEHNEIGWSAHHP